MTKSTRNLIDRIDAALLRMALRGHQDTPGYSRLLTKKRAITAGADYSVTDVTEQLIAGYGGQLANISKLTRIRS
jgi:hypothetical protein